MNAYICLIIAFWLNYLSSIKCKKLAEKHLDNPYVPVYDIIHKNTNKISTDVPEYLLALSFIFALINYLFFVTENYNEKLNNNISYLIYSLILRAVTTCTTIIPTCMPIPIGEKSAYKKIFVSTHDLMYSGHTIIFIFFGKMLEYNSSTNILGKVVQYIFPISLILSRHHYTTDVIVSFLVYNFFNKF
tara:strand:+ start:91 stop:654 length:564 start_codon:yes stop_codon:yes gene_type:complete